MEPLNGLGSVHGQVAGAHAESFTSRTCPLSQEWMALFSLLSTARWLALYSDALTTHHVIGGSSASQETGSMATVSGWLNNEL